MNEPRILVAGVGNIFLGDDAFGVEVAHELARRHMPDCVTVKDFGIRGFDLVYTLLDDYDLTIIIDAAPRGGPPGTLYKIEPDPSDIANGDPPDAAMEPHGMNLPRVFSMVKTIGGTLGRMVVIGCEPAELADEQEGALGLSRPVRAAVDEAVLWVDSTIRETLDNHARREG